VSPRATIHQRLGAGRVPTTFAGRSTHSKPVFCALAPAQVVLGPRHERDVVGLAAAAVVETGPELHAADVGEHVAVVEIVASVSLPPAHER